MQDYIKSIIYVTLISSVLSRLLIGEQYRRYGNILSGFALIVLFLQPFLNWNNVQSEFVNRYESFKKEAKEEWETQEIPQYEEEITELVEQNVKEYVSTKGYRCSKVEVAMKEEGMEQIRIHLSENVDYVRREELKEVLCERYQLMKSQIVLS